MTTGKALDGKPYAGNPLRSRALGFGAAFAAAVLCGTAQARVAYSLDGSRMTITAPSTYAGKSIQLLWGETATEGVYANTNTVCDAVALSGGQYTVDLKEAGIKNGTELHLWACHRYQVLNKIYQPATLYVNTGIKDSAVYGVRLGFCLEQTFTADPTFRNIIGTGIDTKELKKNGGIIPDYSTFTVGFRQHSTDDLRLYYESQGAEHAYERYGVAKDDILDIAFTNGVLTIGGVSKKTGLNLSPVGHVSDYTKRVMLVGRRDIPIDVRQGQGWWSHVQFDGEGGKLILDYVPVKDCAKGTIGFFDRAAETPGVVATSGSGSFATTSSGSDKESAPTGKYIETDHEDLGQTITPNRELTFTLEGSALVVSVPAGLVGERLVLLWDDEDMGDDPAAWSHSAVISESARAAGETVRLGKLGVKNGQYVRVAAANAYKMLDTLYMGGKQCYINTGFKDTEVYGVRFGFYGNSCSEPNSGWGYCIGSKEGTPEARGFIVGMSGTSYDKYFWTYTGKRPDAPDRPATSTTSINEIAFTNRVFTLDGKKVFGTLAAGSVGISTSNISIGRCGGDWPGQRYFYGHWSHVSFDDADGNKILDYVPVQRVASDGTLGKVGFYDRATKTFVTSTGTGDFTAGAVKDDEEVVSYNSVSAAAEVNGIPGFMIMFR